MKYLVIWVDDHDVYGNDITDWEYADDKEELDEMLTNLSIYGLKVLEVDEIEE